MRQQTNVVRKSVAAALAVTGLLSIGSAARAAVQLHIDINSVTIDASGPSGFTDTNYTGTLTLSENSNTYLAGVDFDGISQSTSPSVSILDDSGTGNMGTITFSSGVITGGSLAFAVMDGATTTDYSADIVTNSGNLLLGPPNAYYFSGATVDNNLDNSMLAGVNVSQWAGQSLGGSLSLSNILAGASEGVGQLEIYIVPEPGCLGLIALTLLGTARRRPLT